MRNRLRFKQPTGNKIINPTEAQLWKSIFNTDTNYWSKESDAMIDFYNTDPNIYQGDISLIFFYDDPYGFFLYYDVEFVPIKKNVTLKDEIVVEHFIGGEPMRIPSICYRTREEAWEIVLDFINEQKMNEKYNWVPLADIEYDIGPYG
jgi:hypothetical protein